MLRHQLHSAFLVVSMPIVCIQSVEQIHVTAAARRQCATFEIARNRALLGVRRITKWDARTTLRVNLISGPTPGDNFNSAVVSISRPDEIHGSQAKVGVGATYKTPLFNPSSDSTDLYSAQMGFGQSYGEISEDTLTITQIVAGGINVQGSSFLTGSGVAVGAGSSTGTYVGQSSSTNGGIGS